MYFDVILGKIQKSTKKLFVHQFDAAVGKVTLSSISSSSSRLLRDLKKVLPLLGPQLLM